MRGATARCGSRALRRRCSSSRGACRCRRAPARFECIVATDVFYSHEAVAPLARTLSALAGANTEVLLAAGRNRQAADAFFAHAAAEGWAVALVDRKSLDPLFQSPEIDVWEVFGRTLINSS